MICKMSMQNSKIIASLIPSHFKTFLVPTKTPLRGG